MNAITKTNGNGALDPAIMESLVIGGDLSGLNNKQRIDYYGYRCTQAGLDPSAKPFDLLKLNGKLVLYANAGCTQQLCQIHGLSPTITDRTIIDGIFAVTSRVTGKDGRVTENIGAVPVKGLAGDALSNAMMKAVTKAHRRTILAHCGLGMLSEDEVETIPGAQIEKQGRGNPLRQDMAAWNFEIQAAKSQEQMDLIVGSPEFAEFSKACDAQHERGGMHFADQLRDQAETLKKKLPPKIMRDVSDDTGRVQMRPATEFEQANGGREPDVAPGDGSSTTPPASNLSDVYHECAERFDIVDTADDFRAAQQFALGKQKDLSADEKKSLNDLSKKVGARLRETA